MMFSYDSLKKISPDRSCILDWYDGVVKALLYYSDLDCWIYTFMLASNRDGKSVYGMCFLDSKVLALLNIVLSKEGHTLEKIGNFSQEDYDLIISFLNENARASDSILLVKTSDLMRGFEASKLDSDVSWIPEAEEIFTLESDKINSWFERVGS